MQAVKIKGHITLYNLIYLWLNFYFISNIMALQFNKTIQYNATKKHTRYTFQAFIAQLTDSPV